MNIRKSKKGIKIPQKVTRGLKLLYKLNNELNTIENQNIFTPSIKYKRKRVVIAKCLLPNMHKYLKQEDCKSVKFSQNKNDQY